MAVDVLTEIVINRPCHEVASYAAHPDNAPHWYVNINTWEPASAGHTRMTLRNRGTPSGFGVVMAPFMAMAIRRANQKDLARLKAILEREKR